MHHNFLPIPSHLETFLPYAMRVSTSPDAAKRRLAYLKAFGGRIKSIFYRCENSIQYQRFDYHLCDKGESFIARDVWRANPLFVPGGKWLVI